MRFVILNGGCVSLAGILRFFYNLGILWRFRMAEKKWQTQKTCYCERVGREIRLEAQVVYPAEHLPEQPPRIVAHRCSNGIECNRIDKMVCDYAGTNPEFKPL